jgi:hypothetical protein
MNIIRTHRIGTVIMALALLTGVAMDVEASSRRRGGRSSGSGPPQRWWSL